MSHEELVAKLRWRYSPKKFDNTKKVSDADWKALEQALVLTPSSHGLQPWQFIVVKDPAVRKLLRAQSWNQSQIEDCSHLVVLCVLEKVDQTWVDRYIKTMSEIRGLTEESLLKLRTAITGDVVTGNRSAIAKEWATRQVYIALGSLITAAATLSIDTCPMEGLDPKGYDKVLGLEGTGFGTVVACAVGYRAQDDWLGALKKVRFDTSDVVKYI